MKQRGISLIVQGPLIHRGFDCLSLLEYRMLKYRYLFEEVVISTWESETRDALEYLHDLADAYNLKIVLSSQPTLPKNSRIGDTRKLHFYSALRGMSEIKGIDNVVVKIRSDLHIELDKVLEFYRNKTSQISITPIGVLWSWKTNLFSACDWMYISHFEVLKSFFCAQIELSNQNFSLGNAGGGEWPERDTLLKFLWFTSFERNESLGQRIRYFPKTPKDIASPWSFMHHGLSEHHTKLQETILKDFILTMPSRIAHKASIRRNDNRPWQRKDLLYFEDQEIVRRHGYLAYLKAINPQHNGFLLRRKSKYLDFFLGKFIASELHLYEFDTLRTLLLKPFGRASRWVHLKWWDCARLVSISRKTTNGPISRKLIS
jgi:hypothetical protein